MNKPFQRRDAESNTQVGRDFEAKAGQFFAGQGLRLSLGIEIPIGINGKKLHKFDLGDPAKKVIESGNFRRLGGLFDDEARNTPRKIHEQYLRGW